jgi:collagen type I/II/III/V/XI/XXIV/XXVII alpha
MATRTWTLSGGGGFGSSSGWSNSTAPVAGDTADITNVFSGAAYSVQVTDAEAAALINLGAANAQLAVESGGVLTTGAIDVTAGTLAVLSGGEITGGTTITFAPAAQFSANDGTLDGVTWMGTLGLLGVSQASLLTVTTSLNVLNTAGTGPGEIDITGPGATMNVASSMTIDGTGGNLAINIGTSSAQNEFLSIGSGDVLTLGSHVSVTQTGTSNVWFSDVSTGGTLVNQGTMTFSAGTGASAEINTNTVINSGSIIASCGALNGESLDITALTGFTDTAQGKISISDFGRVGISGLAGSFDVDGQISVSGDSTLDLNTNTTGSGSILISASSTADMFNYTGSVIFLDATGDLALEQPSNYTGTVIGLQRINSGTKDIIDLLNTQVTSIQPYTGDASGGTLTVMDNSSPVATITLLGNYVGQTFRYATDSAGTGSDIFLGCFAAGTRIATPAGDAAVEDLCELSLVTIATGEAEKIVWLGRRHIDCARHKEPTLVWPVRIQAGAFGGGLPRRDLFLSPDHAVFVDDVLIPIKALINGTSIAQTLVDEITYYHVELRRHDLLLAEGLAVESYLESGNRSNFAEPGKLIRLFPDFATCPGAIAGLWETSGRAPLVVTGPKLDAARRRMDTSAVHNPWGRRAAP